MIQTIEIMRNIDHITEELVAMKKGLLSLEIEDVEKSKKAWERIKRASRGIKWDEVDAVEEIRRQRG
ncbi:MAG: hypothetical protein ABIF11_05025 [Nitrospirota bacterium]